MTKHMKDLADDVMKVRDRLDHDMAEERETLLRVRDRITAMVDEVGETKPARKQTSAKRKTKVTKTKSKPSAIGQSIKDAREHQEMTRRGLAKEAGVSELSLRKIEEGETQKPHAETVDKINKALGVTLES